MSTAQVAAARLREPSGKPAEELAEILVDQLLTSRFDDLVDVPALASALREVLGALSASDSAELQFVSDLKSHVATLAAAAGAPEALMPAPLRDLAPKLAGLLLTVPRETVVHVMDREPVRALIRSHLIDTLTGFGKKAMAPVSDSNLGRGLGGLSKMAFGQLASRSAPLGQIATAISGEVERQTEKRAAEFADTAVATLITRMGDELSDRAKAGAHAEARADVTNALLTLPNSSWAAMLGQEIEKSVKLVRAAVAGWVASPGFDQDISRACSAALGPHSARTLGEVLELFGVKDAVRKHAVLDVQARLVRLFGTDAFAEWLSRLVT